MCETIWRKSYLGGRAKGAEDAAGKVFLAGHRPVVASGDGHWLYDARGWPDPGNRDWLQEKLEAKLFSWLRRHDQETGHIPRQTTSTDQALDGALEGAFDLEMAAFNAIRCVV